MRRLVLFVLCVFIITVGYTGNLRGVHSLESQVALKEVQPFSYCCIPYKGPYTQIPNAIPALLDAMRMQNIHPAGQMISVFYNSPEEVTPEELEWEVGFPVMSQIALTREPLLKKQWLYKQVVSSIHVGPYQNVGETYEQMLEWITANNYIPDGPVLERYLTMPTPDTNPEDYRTELWIPIKTQ